MASTYGVSTDKMFYEPADAGLPTENAWSTSKYLDHVPRLFEALRVRFGAGPHLLHDVHHRLTPIEAARLGKSLEPYRLFWMEDATPAENQANFRLIRQHTVTPLAVGEVFNTIWDCKQLVEEQLDRLHPHDRRPCRRNHSPEPNRGFRAQSTTCAWAATAQPIFLRCAWARRCI